jgi:glucan phosphoethanolaminetransferase (alkaline phosphatase superfamily)
MNTALIYLSDHGESLGENGLYLHGTPYMIAPKQQTHIPFMFWLSADYQKGFGIDEQCLRQQAQNEAVSIIGTTDVEYKGDAKNVEIDESEIGYLLKVYNAHFKKQLGREDVVWTYSGVRP